jgi:hypothetical protein
MSYHVFCCLPYIVLALLLAACTAAKPKRASGGGGSPVKPTKPTIETLCYSPVVPSMRWRLTPPKPSL